MFLTSDLLWPECSIAQLNSLSTDNLPHLCVHISAGVFPYACSFFFFSSSFLFALLSSPSPSCFTFYPISPETSLLSTFPLGCAPKQTPFLCSSGGIFQKAGLTNSELNPELWTLNSDLMNPELWLDEPCVSSSRTFVHSHRGSAIPNQVVESGNEFSSISVPERVSTCNRFFVSVQHLNSTCQLFFWLHGRICSLMSN